MLLLPASKDHSYPGKRLKSHSVPIPDLALKLPDVSGTFYFCLPFTIDMRILSLLLLSFIIQASPGTTGEPATVCLSAEEKTLYDLITAYRASKGLSVIPLSAKLTMVAQAHARDLSANYTFDPDNSCNPHSWSAKGAWSSCCYTNDHKQARCMWDKPKEIAGYDSPGYEIAYYSSKGASASEGLAGWQKSPGHNPLIINEGIWAKATWRGIGIGFYKEYGVVWFGEVADDAPISECPPD